jgi:hypothetical protein
MSDRHSRRGRASATVRCAIRTAFARLPLPLRTARIRRRFAATLPQRNVRLDSPARPNHEVQKFMVWSAPAFDAHVAAGLLRARTPD